MDADGAGVMEDSVDDQPCEDVIDHQHSILPSEDTIDRQQSDQPVEGNAGPRCLGGRNSDKVDGCPTFTVQLYDEDDNEGGHQHPARQHHRRRIAKSLSSAGPVGDTPAADDPQLKKNYYMTVCARRLNRHLRDPSLGALALFSLPDDDRTDGISPDEKTNSLGNVLVFSTQSSRGTGRLFIREQQDQESQILADSATKGKKYKSWKYKRAKQWNKNKQAILDLFSYFELWGASLKAIEGSFGSSVVSYFLFVRWLFLLNCFIFLCILSVIILPQALLKPKSFYDSIAVDNGSLMHYQEMAMICSKNYSDFLQESMNDDITAVVLDVFQGTGFLQDTYLFLGYYFNKTYFNDLSQPSFDMPLAHLATTAVYLLITLILMVRYTANGIKEKILSKGYHYHKTWSLVFCGWDYTLTKKKAASYKHISLRKEIQNVLLELELAERQRMMNAKQKACIYIKRIIINIITVGCLGCSFALIYFVIEVWKPQLQEIVLDNDVLTLVIEYLPSVTITALNFCIPFVFSYLVILEEYSPSVELKVHLVRTVFLRLVSLITLAVTMFSVVACNGHEVSCGSCNEKIKCWETYIGQELYKLVILDFFIILGTTFLVEFPRKAIVTRVKKLRVFQQEFDLPVSVLNIVYSQTLSWWGAFYSPLIPGITIVKFFVLFYCKKVSLFVNQTPPHRPYQTSKSNHFFMMILMISFVLSVAALTYTAGWLIPSQGCGPFRVYIMEDYRLYHSLTALISTFPSVLRVIFTTMTSWLAYILLLVILSLVIDFLRAKAAGSERVINILRDQFALLEKDKKFLLDEVRQVPQL